VSTALCADAYVLALVAPEDIRALSWQAGQSVSAAPNWARALPRARPEAETVLALQPDLAVFGAGEGGRTLSLLERTGQAGLELVWGESFETVRANLRRLGAALDDEAAAAREIADLDARLAALEARAAERTAHPRIAYLSSSGGSAGADTYVDAAIRAAGGRNLVAEAGATGWTRSDPEFALTLEADILITSFFVDGYEGRLNPARYHSAYQPLLAAPERVDIPAGDWPCAGPRLIHAAEAIADAIDVWEAGR